MSDDFIGRGWALPVELDASGRVTASDGDERIRQAIWMVLGTSPGERVMRPDFGCGLRDLVFSLNDTATLGAAERQVREALARWEPRVDVLDVLVTPDSAQPNLLLIAISYEVRATNSRENLVYPFYLE